MHYPTTSKYIEFNQTQNKTMHEITWLIFLALKLNPFGAVEDGKCK